MSKRLIASVALSAVATTMLIATPARAETCASLPGTTGATIEVADQEVRVPATSGVAVCLEPGGLPGLPRVETVGGATSVVLGGGSSAEGYVAVRYALDGDAREIRVPIPGGGGGSDVCVVSVGSPARADCLVKVSIDEIPPIPPLPVVTPICFSFGYCLPDDTKLLVNDVRRDPVAWVCRVLWQVVGC